MNDEASTDIQDQIDPKYGELLMYWTMNDHPVYQRSTAWYAIFGVGGTALIVYAIITRNYIFALFLIMVGTFLIWQQTRPAQKLPIVLLTAGIAVGNHFHEWEDIRDFAIVYNPPEVRKLYLAFMRRSDPAVSIELPEDMDPNELRQALLLFAKENLDQKDETLTDYVARLYKL